MEEITPIDLTDLAQVRHRDLNLPTRRLTAPRRSAAMA
jgi:hypothetical protein